MKWYVLLIDSSRLYFSLSDKNISPYEPSVSLFPPLRSFPYSCGFGVPKEKYICFTEVKWRHKGCYHFTQYVEQTQIKLFIFLL